MQNTIFHLIHVMHPTLLPPFGPASTLYLFLHREIHKVQLHIQRGMPIQLILAVSRI